VSRVQSIERAFAVLGALADGPVGVTEVAERVDLPKSTVARLLGSLVTEGAVEQVPGETRYRLGRRMATLAARADGGGSLIGIARPHLEELASRLGESAGLAVRDGSSVHYVDQVDIDHQVQIRDWTGTRVPMHAVSSGLVILASLPEPELAAFLARPLERFTKSTMTDAVALRERLAKVRSDGFAWVREEFAEGLSSVAAPVKDAGGSAAAAAVHVHGPSYRFPGDGRETELAARVVDAAATISARLGRARG
jgi:IclR family acetate operon transcriptional repressor